MKKNTKHYTLLFLICCLLLLPHKAARAETYTCPELTSEAAVLMDAKTGQVLFAKNAHKRQYPASITKVMTGLLAVERGSFRDIVTMSHEAVYSIGRNTSHIALEAGEELSFEGALYALAIASANDASNGIAEHISGSLAGFARLMNERAKQLGAENTNFVNAHGLPAENHYTTAYDMAVIMREAIKKPGFLEVFSAVSHEIPPTNKQPETRYLNSRNPLLNGTTQYEGVLAIKSGWTSQANHTLLTAAQQGERVLVVAVLNNQSRVNNYSDTVKLLDYGFQAFLKVGLDLTDLKNKLPHLNFNADEEENLVRLLHKNLSPADLKQSYEFYEGGHGAVQATVSLSIGKPQGYMYPDLGSVCLMGEAAAAAAAAANPSEAEKTAYGAGAAGAVSSYYLPAGFLGLVCLLGIRVIVKRKIEDKRSRRRLHRRYRY